MTSAPASVVPWFFATAQARAAEVALHADGRDITYTELASAARAFAAWLAQQRVAPGDRVLICLPNSPRYAATLIGTLHAQAVAVPLHPKSSPREIERVVEDCAPRVAVVPSDLSLTDSTSTREIAWLVDDAAGHDPRVPSGPVPRTTLQEVLQAAAPAPRGDNTSPPADTLALILYTSGTTGRPKGVMLSHGNLAANFTGIIARLNLTTQSSALLVLPACYAYGHSVLWTHLLAGSRLVLVRSFAFWSQVLDLLVAQRASGFYGVPSSFALLLDRSDFLSRDLPDLRFLACAGGRLPSDAVARICRDRPALALYLMYGQTEATARLTVLDPAQLADADTLGQPLPGVTLDLVDEAGRPVPEGAVGQIVARGPNVMLGYWNNPAETARSLGSSGLRTGDLAQRDSAGRLRLVGRQSEVIKFGALRIHPSEIEEVAREMSQVAEAAVVGLPDPTWGEAPILLAVARSGESIAAPKLTVSDLARFLETRLPRHKLPRHIHLLPELPHTPGGKLDRPALRRVAASLID